MRKVILDASVALKCFPVGGEESVTEARELWSVIQRREVRAFAPMFMLVEVVNILARKKKVKPGVLRQILGRLRDSEIVFVGFEKSDLTGLVGVVLKYGLTAYDAQYLLSAKHLGCKLVTCDEEMLKIKSLTVGVGEWMR